jgi:hypothetical protein
MPPSSLSAKLSLWVLISAVPGALLPRCSGGDSALIYPSAANPIERRFVVPDVVTARIFASEPGSTAPLFTFKRTLTRDGSTLKVLREYAYADGKPADREHVVYENDNLVFYQLEELQTGDVGSATISRDPDHPGKGRISFQYLKADSRRPVSSTRTEALQPDILINDMVGTFLAAHWDQLCRGEKVGFRYVVLSRRETVGFTFKKESEMQWRGKNVLVLKMEPSSFVIAALIDPLRFLVERDHPHRVLQYSGPTAPKLGRPGHWTELDAVTIFDW